MKTNKNLIMKISITFNRFIKIFSKNKPKEFKEDYITINYFENIIVDRATQTIEQKIQWSPQCIITQKYEIYDIVDSLLENSDPEKFFMETEGNPDNIIKNPNDICTYTITIDYKKGKQKILSGTFDKKALPKDFGVFAKNLKYFIDFYGDGEIINPNNYNKIIRRENEYIFCSVIFSDNGKSFYYLSDKDDISVCDLVVVPVGKNNIEKIGEVVNVEYFAEENVPFPLNKTKKIIRTCTDEDMKNLEKKVYGE